MKVKYSALNVQTLFPPPLTGIKKSLENVCRSSITKKLRNRKHYFFSFFAFFKNPINEKGTPGD